MCFIHVSAICSYTGEYMEDFTDSTKRILSSWNSKKRCHGYARLVNGLMKKMAADLKTKGKKLARYLRG